MARSKKALVVAVCMMFLNNLYECGPIAGYKCPVYTTASCPKNKAEWLERSFGLNCTDQNGYMCIPNEMFVLVEFCYTKNVAIPEGFCLILNKRSSAVDAYRCQDFSYGCPSDQYFSNRIYEHQSCVSIMEGCFLADPYCERTVTANRKTATSKYNTEEGIGTNSITTGIPYLTFLMIIIVTIISSLIAGHYFGTVKTRITRRCSKGSTGHDSDPTTEQLTLHNVQNIPLESPPVDETESSINENSNQGPLTNSASVH